jgi:hypothetical protein
VPSQKYKIPQRADSTDLFHTNIQPFSSPYVKLAFFSSDIINFWQWSILHNKNLNFSVIPADTLPIIIKRVGTSPGEKVFELAGSYRHFQTELSFTLPCSAYYIR